MEGEKNEKTFLPKKEEFKRIQRIELDPENKVDIVISDTASSGYTAEVVIEKDGKIIKDFKDEVPGNTDFFSSIEPWGARYYSGDDGTIELRMPMHWENGKDLLSFLHEIGHVINFSKHPEKEQEVRRLFVLIDNAIRGRSEITQQDFIKYKEKLNLLQANTERDAWANALKLVKKIKTENGVDLLRPLRGRSIEETKSNLEKFIHSYALSSHEKRLREEIVKFGLDKKLEGIFTKKYKEEAEEISKEVSEEALK